MSKHMLLIKNLLSAIIFSIFIIMAVGSIDTNDPNYVSFSEIKEKMKDPNYWKTTDNSSMAYIMMEGFVEDRLRSPSSAKFPGVFDGKLDHVRYLGNQRYIINSYVDAQNGFGAMIRNNFTGEIEQTGKDYWQLKSLIIS